MTTEDLTTLRRDYLRALNSGDVAACSAIWSRVRRDENDCGAARAMLCSLGKVDCDRQLLEDLAEEIAQRLPRSAVSAFSACARPRPDSC